MGFNTHTAGTQRQRKRNVVKKGGNGHVMAILFAVVFMIVITAFGFVNRTVEYSSQAEELAVYIAKTNREIKQLESEISYLNVEKEGLMSRNHIVKKISEFKLGLRAAMPQQVSYIEHSSQDSYIATTQLPRNKVASLR